MAELYSSSKCCNFQGGNEFKGQLIATRQRNDNATRRLNRERSARSRLNARSRRNDSARTDELLQRILMLWQAFWYRTAMLNVFLLSSTKLTMAIIPWHCPEWYTEKHIRFCKTPRKSTNWIQTKNFWKSEHTIRKNKKVTAFWRWVQLNSYLVYTFCPLKKTLLIIYEH